MQKLECWWNLVVNFENRGYSKKNEKSEIDHGVHEAGGAIAKQCAHVYASAVVG